MSTKIFPRATKEQLVATRNNNIQLQTQNRTTITQLGIFKVKIVYNNKHRICNFFVVQVDGQALLGMPDIETLGIIAINSNKIDAQDSDRTDKCRTSTTNCMGSRFNQHYTNMMKETDRPQKYYTNNSKSNNKDKLMAIDNKNSKINYFLPGPSQDNDKRLSIEIT